MRKLLRYSFEAHAKAKAKAKKKKDMPACRLFRIRFYDNVGQQVKRERRRGVGGGKISRAKCLKMYKESSRCYGAQGIPSRPSEPALSSVGNKGSVGRKVTIKPRKRLKS